MAGVSPGASRSAMTGFRWNLIRLSAWLYPPCCADDAVVKRLGEEGVEEAAAGNQLERLCGLIAVQVLEEDGSRNSPRVSAAAVGARVIPPNGQLTPRGLMGSIFGRLRGAACLILVRLA